MADEQDQDQRTEDATPQRLRKAAEEGNIAFSAELLNGLTLFVGAVYFWFAGVFFFETIGRSIVDQTVRFESVVSDPRSILRGLQSDILSVGFASLTLILPIFLVALLAGGWQTGFNISFKPLTIKWEKLSVVSGVKRIFNSRSLVKGGLAIAKAIIVITVVYLIAKSELDEIFRAGFASYQQLIFFMCQMLLYAALSTAALMLIVGVADFAFQKWKHAQDMKMSIQDLRDEHKETEGDPQLRARVKKIQAEMSQKRMMSDVPGSTVVVTNPTHFAVALRYDSDSMDAPVVVAKGADHVAQAIIAMAKENDVPVVERKPVARYLYAHVQIGKSIPMELYQAVAEILNYIRTFEGAN